jgi:hypothetical protein
VLEHKGRSRPPVGNLTALSAFPACQIHAGDDDSYEDCDLSFPSIAGLAGPRGASVGNRSRTTMTQKDEAGVAGLLTPAHREGFTILEKGPLRVLKVLVQSFRDGKMQVDRLTAVMVIERFLRDCERASSRQASWQSPRSLEKVLTEMPAPLLSFSHAVRTRCARRSVVKLASSAAVRRMNLS